LYPRYFRPIEVETLLGDASKAKQKLSWLPQISFAELVTKMVQADLREARFQSHVHNSVQKALRIQG